MFPLEETFDLTVDLNEATNRTKSHLERVRQLLQDEQFDDAMETLLRVLEAPEGELIRMNDGDDAFGLYAPIRDYCHRMLVRMHRDYPEALALYRSRVDPLAARWIAEARRDRDHRKMKQIVAQMFASSSGDDALLALGDMALERGEWDQARLHWERISPRLRTPSQADVFIGYPGAPLWMTLRKFDFANRRDELVAAFAEPAEMRGLVYPDTDLDLAPIRARLTLTSIFEGALERAAVEIKILRALHPGAEGRLGAKQGAYDQLLDQLLAESKTWQPPPESTDWPVFAGSAARERSGSPIELDPPMKPLWTVPLDSDRDAARDQMTSDKQRVGEERIGVLDVHPIVIGDTVFVAEASAVRAFHLHTGEPAFSAGGDDLEAADPSGAGDEADTRAVGRFFEFPFPIPRYPPRAFAGVSRYTLSSSGRRLFAKMGVTWTSTPRIEDVTREQRGVVLGFDLNEEGKLLPGFPLAPDDERWAFEGPPVSDGKRLLVAMRRRDDVRAEAHIAAFDMQTGERIWRTQIAASSIPANWVEVTHTLLTLHEGVAYINTNLGVVGAVDAETGQLRWVAAYPRAEFRPKNIDKSDLHYLRDLNPPLVYRGRLIVAPRDSDRILALDVATGALLWRTAPELAVDAQHLLGVADGNLIASGDYLYWIDIDTGRWMGQFPAAKKVAPGFAVPSPRTHGRGLVLAGSVVWPTRDKLFVFDAKTERTPQGWSPVMKRPPIELEVRGATGGNLVVSQSVLLIAAADRLYAFSNPQTTQVSAGSRKPQQDDARRR
jgi:outer membrane protein assembly factor BamB